MTTSLSKPGNGPATPMAAARQRLCYRLWALVLAALGAFLLAHQLGLLPGPLAQAAAFWPLLLILIGLRLVTGRASLGFALPAFAIDRGDYQSAHLHLAAGLADAQVSTFVGASQLAVGQFPVYGGPRLQANGSSAALILDRRAVSPFLAGPWTVSLVKGLPWSFTLHSDAGHFNLNLRDLTVTALDLQSGVGDVEVTLPALGQGEMALRLGLGDLTVRVPDGMAVKIKLAAGPLTRIRLDDQRFIQTHSSEWVTPNFSASPQQFTLSIALTAGDLQVI
jgi:hypothetical protein